MQKEAGWQQAVLQDSDQDTTLSYRYHSDFCSLKKQKTNQKETQCTVSLLFLLSHSDLQAVGVGLQLGSECGKKILKGLCFSSQAANTLDQAEGERGYACSLVICSGQMAALLWWRELRFL